MPTTYSSHEHREGSTACAHCDALHTRTSPVSMATWRITSSQQAASTHLRGGKAVSQYTLCACSALLQLNAFVGSTCEEARERSLGDETTHAHSKPTSQVCGLAGTRAATSPRRRFMKKPSPSLALEGAGRGRLPDEAVAVVDPDAATAVRPGAPHTDSDRAATDANIMRPENESAEGRGGAAVASAAAAAAAAAPPPPPVGSVTAALRVWRMRRLARLVGSPTHRRANSKKLACRRT